MRLFIAITLNPEIQKELNSLQERFVSFEGIRWIKSQNIHLTLKFLGEVNEQKISLIKQAMQKAGKGISPFSANFVGLGVFPNLKAPRVIWIGIASEKEVVIIQQRLEKELEIFGFSPEKRKFQPHLTLGRVKLLQDKKGFTKEIKELEQVSLSSKLSVDKIELIKSNLSPEGAVYSSVHKCRLE
ncbi:MAG: RNA 2',3'-cyclic phosphodiesterase [Candidatus Omnitrophica bacterium]|nr:RNA 2',3'-cyclic phosphodiesterase [Candidatus Omnitrophota bacterium]